MSVFLVVGGSRQKRDYWTVGYHRLGEEAAPVPPMEVWDRGATQPGTKGASEMARNHLSRGLGTRSFRPRMIVAVLLPALIALPGGCSFMFVKGSPSADVVVRERDPLPYCTSSTFWPVTDLMWTLFMGYSFASAIDAHGSFEVDSDPDKQSQLKQQIVGGFVLGILAVASAGVGFSRISDCKAFVAEARASQRARSRFVPSRAPSAAPRPISAPLTQPGVGSPVDTGPDSQASPATPAPGPQIEAAPAVPAAVDDEDPGTTRRSPGSPPPPPARRSPAPPPPPPPPPAAAPPAPPVPPAPAAPRQAPWQPPSTPGRG
jgi:hypothetical protein